MKDKRIWEFKRRAEEDNFITAGACRLILRIASWRYCTKHHPADAEFSLSWRHMAAWYDHEGPEAIKNRKTIYDWIRELVHNRYLLYNGRKGCPAQSCYRLELDYKPERLWLFDWAAEQASRIVKALATDARKNGQLDARKNGQLDARKNGQLDARKNAQPEFRKNAQPVARKNRPPKYSYSLREEMIKTKGKKIQARSARTGDSRGRKSSSLRSTGTPPLTLSDGQDASAVPDSDGSSKHSHVEDRALSHPDNLSATSGTGGTIPPARGRNPAARSSQDEVVALHSARFTIEQGCAYQLTERHVRALLKAGDTLPPEVAEKFAALCDEFNPMPG